MGTVANTPLFLVLAWWAFMSTVPALVVCFIVYMEAAKFGIPEIRTWTTGPRFLVAGIVLSYGYGVFAATGFLVKPVIGSILLGYLYVACLLWIAIARGIVDKPSLRTVIKVIGGIGTLLPATAIVVFMVVE